MDWRRFLEENNIHFVDRGPNTKRGEMSIQCPMCGDDDPSEHLGINPQTGKWGCHRDSNHRGKSSRTLVKAILGCSSQQAQLIVKQYNHSDPDTLEGALMALEADSNEAITHDEDIAKMARRQALGPQFKDFNKIKEKGVTRRFFNYLIERGYDDPNVIIEKYNLRCCMTGRFKDRIIIPISLNGELLGWTARAIGAPKNAPRYLASSEDVKSTVFNYDEIKSGGDRLFIVEGPFDAIKIDNHGLMVTKDYAGEPQQPLNMRATCVFGTSQTVSQKILLRNLIKKFKQTWILFDRGADKAASDLADWIGCGIAFLPSDVDDPGELEISKLDEMTSRIFNGFFRINPAFSPSMFQQKPKQIKNLPNLTLPKPTPFWQKYKP